MGTPCDALTRVAAVAVLQNQFAGSGQEDLSALFDIGAMLGERLAAELITALGATPLTYGKAAIVGSAGAAEHGAALLHPRLGKPVRQAIGGGQALRPSTIKVASAGTAVDVPLGHKDEAWSFDHIDTMTITVPDSPRANEIMVASPCPTEHGHARGAGRYPLERVRMSRCARPPSRASVAGAAVERS